MLDKDSYAYKKYVSRHDPRSPENISKRKKERVSARRAWWAANWIALLGILIAVVALVFSALSLKIAWLSYRAEQQVHEVAQSHAQCEGTECNTDDT